MNEIKTECFKCEHKRSIPGNYHISCLKPDANVCYTGHENGRKNGWFSYPFNFDPVWKMVKCENFKEKK